MVKEVAAGRGDKRSDNQLAGARTAHRAGDDTGILQLDVDTSRATCANVDRCGHRLGGVLEGVAAIRSDRVGVEAVNQI